MTGKHNTIVVLFAIASVAVPSMALAQREGPRPFPQNQLCPFHLGYALDPLTGEPIEEDGEKVFRTPDFDADEGMFFVAEGKRAGITLLACDEGGAFTQGSSASIDVLIEDFDVVERSVFEGNQAETTVFFANGRLEDPETEEFRDCYQSLDGEIPIFRIIGSVFERDEQYSKHERPFTDDFDDQDATEASWLLNGGFVLFDEGDGKLVLAQGDDLGRKEMCSTATVVVDHLVEGETYVIDFKWDVAGFSKNQTVIAVYVDHKPPK